MANITVTATAGSYLTTGSDISFSIISGGAPIEPPAANYAGGGASRGRMIRKFRKRKDEEEEPLEVVGSTPVPPPPSKLSPPPLPPQPGLMAGISTPPITVLRSPPVENEDEIEIALLLELLS
jgi:hypothetical protein